MATNPMPQGCGNANWTFSHVNCVHFCICQKLQDNRKQIESRHIYESDHAHTLAG